MATGHDHAPKVADNAGRLWIALALAVQKLYDALSALPGVQEVHDLHVWSITSGQNSLSVHLTVAPGQPDLSLVQAARQVAEAQGIEHTTVQLDEPQVLVDERGGHPWPIAEGVPPVGINRNLGRSHNLPNRPTVGTHPAHADPTDF